MTDGPKTRAGDLARIDTDDAVDSAKLAISTASDSHKATIVLFRWLADEFGSRSIDLAADRLEGTATRTGPKGIDDAAALARIMELRPRLDEMSVAFVARQMFPGDKAAQDAAARRWRRKLTPIRTR